MVRQTRSSLTDAQISILRDGSKEELRGMIREQRRRMDELEVDVARLVDAIESATCDITIKSPNEITSRIVELEAKLETAIDEVREQVWNEDD